MDPNQIEVACYENNVPSFVAAEMDRLYGNFFSSYRALELPEQDLTRINTYAARRGGHYDAIFLFLREHGKVRVLNEVIRVDSAQISQFSDYIFAAFDDVHVISFRAIETDIGRIAYPHQRFNYSEDIAMNLPETVQEYHASLGKNTRRNIKRYTDKTRRSFPSFQFSTFEKENIGEAQVRQIVGLNRERMASKQKISALDEQETQRIIRRAQSCGLVGILTIEGKICAGAISYCTGENFFLDVLAHDSAYNDYWIGIICCYLTICECIARGGKEFHFLWGRYDYKFALGASLRDLDCVTVYRSRMRLLQNCDIAAITALRGYARRVKIWLYDKDNPTPARILKFFDEMRNIRKMTAGLLSGRGKPTF